MKSNLNTHASASALAKVLGVEFTQLKEFKGLLEDSDLVTVTKSHTIKNKVIEYEAYDIIEAVGFALRIVDGNHVKSINIASAIDLG